MKSAVPRWFPIVFALSCVVAIPVTAPAAQPGAPALVSDMPLPGGIAALLRFIDVPASDDPATAMLAVVRVAHVGKTTAVQNLVRYFDAISRLQTAVATLPNHVVAIGRSGPLPAVQAWAGACGLTIAFATVVAGSLPEEIARRRVLEQAGVPVAEWIDKVNAGETVRVDLPTDMVPLPLAPDVWAAAVLHRVVPRAQLAAAIFGDRQAALVYHGLMALDDETLAYLQSNSELLSVVAARSAGVFAEWGRSLHVKNGRIQLAGGQDTAPLWANVIGQAPADADRFIRALFARDGGRAAWFYDTVMHLDPARQAFALGTGLGGDRAREFSALYDSFAHTKTVDSSDAWPVVRHPMTPAMVLAQVRVTDGGRLAAPSSRAFWEAVFSGTARGCASLPYGGLDVDAGWLADRIEREFLEKRSEWLGAVTFAQRVFGHATAAAMPAACEAVASFPHDQALLLTLERLHLDDPADYVGVIRFAQRLWAGVDRLAAVVRTAQAQGVLVILERAVSARVIDQATVRRLVMSLTAVTPGAPARPAAAATESALAPGGIGRWMRATLLPELCRAQGSPDACLVRAVAGQGVPGNAGASVTWEDESYRIDLGAATAVRLDRVRQVQKATPIEDGLTLLSVAEQLSDPRASADELQRQASLIRPLMANPNLDLSDLFGHGIPDMRATLRSAAARLGASASAAERADAASSFVQLSDLLLADALVSFAYTIAIGDPDDAVLMAGDPARRHRFDSTMGPATEPWHLPQEVQALDRTWLTEGSIFALHIVFAKSWLRRLSIQDPGLRPRPEPQDVLAFGESEALFNAFDLTDASRDAIVVAIRRGRARFKELLAMPGSLWTAGVDAGISEWRCRAAEWVAARARAAGESGRATDPDPGDYVSLSEFMWLGAPDLAPAALDAWGVSARTIDGNLTPRMPRGLAWEDFQGPRGVGVMPAYVADVHLHVAWMLADLHLPAVLAPGIASYVMWDVMTTAKMAHPDDWLALVQATRRLPDDRTFDYVSALTATGPLVPAK